MSPRLLLGAVLLTAALPATARQDARVTRIDARDGLSHNTVNDIMQSRDGYLWIATYDGLNRYNGQEFEVYRFPVKPDSLGRVFSNVMDNLFEDDAGRIWFSSIGIGYLDRSTQRLVMRHPTPWPDHRAQQYRIAIRPDGEVWECGARVSGDCARVLPDSAVFIPEDINTWDPKFDDSGSLWWVETDALGRGLVLYRRDEEGVVGKEVPGARLEPSVQAAFTLVEAERAWIAGFDPGLFDFETGDREPVVGWPEGMLASIVRELADGVVLLGTAEGVYRWDPSAMTLRHIPLLEEATPIGLWVQEIIEDREGLVWLGTRSGLYKLDWNALPFRHLGSGLATDPLGLPVALEMEAEEDYLWVGTLGRGLVRVGPREHREFSRRLGSFCGNQGWSTLRLGEALWVSTEDGLCSLLPDGSYRYLRPSKDGGVLAPASSGGAWYWSGDSQGPIVLLDTEGREVQEVYADLVPWSLLDDGRHLWIGASGLHRFRLDALDSLETLGLISNLVIDMTPGSDSLLWLATDGGPVGFDRATREFQFVDAERPLPGRTTYGIAEDHLGRLWMGTNRGLVRLDPQTGLLRVYASEDGVRNLEYDRRAVAIGPDGTFHFGGLDGVTVFDPTEVHSSALVPRVAIASAHLEQTGRPATRVSVQAGGVLSVPAAAHSFTLRLDPLLFSDPGRVQTRYRLLNYVPDWIEGRDIRYSRVPPGRYVFEAEAMSVDGVLGPATSVEVIVEPRFWQTWWFRFLVVAFVSGVVWAFVSVRVAHRRRVEAMRLRIATDLHDEVGSHLSGIAMMADVIRRRRPDGRLEEISSSAREIVQRLREIVWAVDPSTDHGGTLAEHISETAEMMLAGHEWELRVEGFHEGQPLDVHVRNQIALIVREALHNVVRHASARSVTISLRRKKAGVEVSVQDDGCGFESHGKGHGLGSMRHRAASLGGELEVASSPGRGTMVRLVAPTQRQHRWRNRAMPDGREIPTVEDNPR